MKLKLFSSKAYFSDKADCIPMLYPFWEYPPESSDDPKSGMFDDYINVGNSLFELSPLEEADLAVLPTDWEPVLRLERQEAAVQFVQHIKQSDKRSISFFSGDCSHLQLPINTDLIFRHSLYRSIRELNSFAFPAWSEDFVQKYLNHQLLVRQKSAKPVVGFCGFAVTKSLKTYAKHFLYQGRKFFLKEKAGVPPYNIGHVLRLWALSKLSKSKLIEPNFVQRDYPVFFTEPDFAFQQRMRMEYVQNMVDSDYVFCCRGSGNYSFRFYETLSCGRIPVFVDTDCVLPYDFAVNWKNYCVWVKETELHKIDEKIAEFHERISPQEFINLQYECRNLWEQWIAPAGFHRNLYRHLAVVQENANPLSLEVASATGSRSL
mgnify:FL=1